MGEGHRFRGAVSGGIDMNPGRAWARLWALLRKQRFERELDDDIRAPLKLAEEDAVARGLSREAARLEARRRFGAIEQMKEEHRDRCGIRWLGHADPGLPIRPSLGAAYAGVHADCSCRASTWDGRTVGMFSVVDAVL